MAETVFSYKTRSDSSPENKPKVFFTCHPDDFAGCFDLICNSILELQDCAVFYTEDMSCALNTPEIHAEMESMALFVIPVTRKLLSPGNRARYFDFNFAKRKNIPVLPILMESDIGDLYSNPENFGNLEYLEYKDSDEFKDKLDSLLESVLNKEKIVKKNSTTAKEFNAEQLEEYKSLSARSLDCFNNCDFQNCVDLSKQCYDLCLNVLGEDNLRTISAMDDLAVAYLNNGNYSLSIEMLENCITLSKNTLGEDHSQTIRASSNLAAAYLKSGNSNKTIELYEKCYELRKKTLGEDHKDTKKALKNLAIAYKKLWEKYNSIEYIEKYYALMRKIYGEESKKTIYALFDLARSYSNSGNYRKSIDLYERCYALEKNTLGEEHTSTIKTINNLAFAYKNYGNQQKCVELLEQCYELRKKVLGEEDELTIKSKERLEKTKKEYETNKVEIKKEFGKSVFKYITKGDSSPENKPKVYFTCHPSDFSTCFEKICNDIFESQDCVIFYTEDMDMALDDPNIHVDLERMSLFVIPVTYKLLSTGNRAMNFDFRFAQRKNIPVLPLMMESGISELYCKPNKFGELQYLKPNDADVTSIDYKDKLKKYLETILISEELAQKIRTAFDAYIFLSYRKKDRQYANELMKLIHRNPECEDIAIWFDEFLVPGESFRENISKILKDSELFALLVTPSLIERHSDGSPNYIMRVEYPDAMNMGKRILPAEMIKTDKSKLSQEFKGIPDCTDPKDEELFNKRLLDSLVGIAISENNNDPEHIYLIGLAYLKGIDVEIDVERGVKLITKAADAGLNDAMIKLYTMYRDGDGVPIDYKKALEWILKIYENTCNTNGLEDPETLDALHYVAFTYSLAGDIDNSIKNYEQCYQLRTSVLGETHPDTIETLNGLATTYSDYGDIYKGLELIEKCYQVRKETLGDNDKNTIIALGNLAAACGDVSYDEMMYKLSEECYELACSNFGEEDSVSLTALNNYALSCFRWGDIDRNAELKSKGLDLLIKCYTLNLKVYGVNNPHTLITMLNLADIYKDLRNFQKGLEFAYYTYQTICSVLGDEHPYAITATKYLSDIYGYIGNTDKCMEFAEKCCELSSKLYGEDNAHTFSAYISLSRAYARAGKKFRRLKTIKSTYKKCKQVLEMDNPTTLRAMFELACAYARVGRLISSWYYLVLGFFLTLGVFGKSRNMQKNYKK